MAVRAAGEFRRTPLERSDQLVAWERSDQAFFAAGACHVLAWTCRDLYIDQGVGLEAVRKPGAPYVFHTYATWNDWTFDHSGWHPEPRLLEVNATFEGSPLERVTVGPDLAGFCAEHRHRMPADYWRDPLPRARAYVGRHQPPWSA